MKINKFYGLKNKRKDDSNTALIIGLAAAGIAAGVAAVSHSLNKILVNEAFSRDGSRLTKKVTPLISGDKVSRKDNDDLQKYIDDLKSKDISTVEIISYDSTRLTGHWYECENAKRVIVAMHGWRSDWLKDFAPIAKFWHDNGCSVLFAEQRGQGESDGENISFGMTERFDCREWVNWVNKKTNCEYPVYLAGVSMGAATVLMTAGLRLPENVRGIIDDCGYTSIEGVWEHITNKNLHMSYAIRKYDMDSLCRKKIGFGASEINTTDIMKENKIPVLFIHGSADRFVPIEMTYKNYLACSAPKRLLVVPGASHAMSYITDSEAYERALKEFWDSFDNAEN